MGRTYESISPQIAEFIAAQKVVFVGTAPSEGGHVNVSPKGHDSVRVIDAHTVAYLDLTGSGAETIAHVRQNGRVTLMWCAFDGPPRIVRVQGSGSVLTLGDAGFAEAAARFPDHAGARAVITVSADRVADSCGYTVPLMEYVGERTHMEKWCAGKSDGDLAEYRTKKNSTSIDGLPAWLPTDALGA